MTKTLLLSALLFFLISCLPKPSSQEALNYSEKIVANIAVIQDEILTFNHTVPNYLLNTLQKSDVIGDTSKIREFKDLNRIIIKNIHLAQDNIKALPDIKAESKIKIGTLKYLGELLKIHEGAMLNFLSIFDDGKIEEPELAKVAGLQESINKIKSEAKDFNDILDTYFKEFNIPDSQIDELFKKYGISLRSENKTDL